MVLLESGKLPHTNYVNIWNLPELRGIEVTANEVTLGALTTYTDVQNHPILREEFPMLCQAASETGGLAIQNRGTLGGNIVNASPAADSPPALLGYTRNSSWYQSTTQELFHFQIPQRLQQMTFKPGELLRTIRLPRIEKSVTHTIERSARRTGAGFQRFASLAVAAADEKINRCACAWAASLIPIRCVKTEAVLLGKSIDAETIKAARDALANEISPIGDIRSTRDYRLKVSLNLLEDFLSQLGR